MGGFEDGAPASDFADLYQRRAKAVLHTVLPCRRDDQRAKRVGCARDRRGTNRPRHPLDRRSQLLAHLREHDIPLEISISSNVRTDR
jgi:hypothetical protein